MKLPKSVTIKGEVWKISRSPDIENVDKWGEAEIDTRTITLSSNLKGDKLKHYFLHEFIHACLHELHVVDVADGVEEIVADGLAKCLMDSFDIKPK